LGLPRWSAYGEQKAEDLAAAELTEKIKARLDFWHTNKPCYGTRKLVESLKKEGFDVGRKKVRRLMAEMGIYAVYPKPKTSQPGKGHKKYPYLLRNMDIWLPNQVWAIDITYIPMSRGHMYLTAIIDWYSRYIVGWALSDTLETAPVIEAVRVAMRLHGVPAIINSDQGCQFTSEAYTDFLSEVRIRQSMDGKARWVDNVIIERWFRSLKTEYIYINEYKSPQDLRAGIGDYVREYNDERIHQSLDYLTPAEIYNAAFGQQQAA
jgi:putative transposase